MKVSLLVDAIVSSVVVSVVSVFVITTITITTTMVVEAAPTMVDPTTPGKILGGVLAHIAALPIGGEWWLNAAISGNRPTNLLSTPNHFMPVALASEKDIWGAKAVDIPVRVSYMRDLRVVVTSKATNASTITTRVGIWDDADNGPE